MMVSRRLLRGVRWRKRLGRLCRCRGRGLAALVSRIFETLGKLIVDEKNGEKHQTFGAQCGEILELADSLEVHVFNV
jgi:hypothetical protein